MDTLFLFFFISSHIEGITLGAGEEVDGVAGGASSMDFDRIGEGEWDSERQAAGVYRTRSLARAKSQG